MWWIFAVQHVDVCMFSNGKFKNVVAGIIENHEIRPSEIHRKVYSLLPIKGPTKNWIAVEGTPSHSGTSDSIPLTNYSYKIASSAPRGPQLMDERNVFAIYVSYYIKVKLALSGMGGEVALKLPFILGHIDDSLTDNLNNQQDDGTLVDNKFDDKNAADVISSPKPTITVDSTSIPDDNNCNQICRDDDDTGSNGIKTIETCQNERDVGIDLIVEDLSDSKNPTILKDVGEKDSHLTGNNCNEIERNINVVTAQIHSSAK